MVTEKLLRQNQRRNQKRQHASAVQWAKENATIVHPARGRIPFAPFAYQADFLAHEHESRRIILKARQIGYSQIFALEALHTAITEPESTVLLVSRSQDLAVNLLRYCYQTYNGLTDPPELVKQNESEMGLSNGSRIKSIPANRSTGRGFAATSIYLDEFAYASYADDIYQSVSPAVSQGGRLTIGSTPNGIGNLYHRLFASGSGFWRQRVPWHDCPSYYTPEERAQGIPPEGSAWYLRERPKYTETQWASEYDCSFERSGGGVFRNVHALAIAERANEPLPNHTYIGGLDWALSNDYTVLTIIDVTDKALVYQDRFNGIDYRMQRERIKATCERFDVVSVVAEENAMGRPNNEELRHMGVPVRDFTTTHITKAEIIEDLAAAFEQGNIKVIDDPALISELEAYESDRSASGAVKYGAPAGMHDDTVMSLALAHYGVSHGRPLISFR